MNLIALLLSLSLQNDPDAYVSPAGKDTNPGTKEAPFATIARARDAVRTKAVTVHLRAGTYFLPETLVFKPEDSGVTYAADPGATVVVSGGRRIEGWKKAEGGLWTAQIPEGWRFNQLFIDGKRRTRARTPNEGEYFHVDGEITLDKPAKLKYKQGDLKPEWAARGDVEVIALQKWAEIRMPIRAIDADARVATLSGDCFKWITEAKARYWVENAPEFLDAPGEWHLDRKTGLLSYKPLEGEDPSKVEAIAPTMPQLLRIEGARNLQFRGIAFSHADWSIGPKGFSDSQAAIEYAGAVWAQGAVSCAFERCVVSHVGGYGIDFGRGCKENRIVRCEVVDIGAGGIRIGETALRKEEADRTLGNIVTDSHIHDIGRVFPAGVAIWVGHSSKNLFSHNHIHDTCYSGFSIGWSWGYGPSGAQENIIEFNDVHDIGRGMLADMGGIYTLGTCTGTVIRNNVFHDVWSSTYGGWAIYFDEGSTGVVAENNLAYRCKSNGFHQHYGKENTLRNNIFALNQEAQIARTRKEDHFTLLFERNIIYWKEGKLLSGNWDGGQYRWEKNLFWNPAGTKGLPEKWKEQGIDKDSVIADPLFVDPDKGDFSLKADSPALKLGFQPIDVSKVGPRP
ncbi:MAG: right-handed parallel beta-helix repeat-containing protein [Planctomycetes bacterium]|nr:right-handed parallel beta-helix repeat-containing protein [Planctomycetota bacterium]